MKNRGWLEAAFIYIGTVIGAGFASGQEIVHFFAVYGTKGMTGMLIAIILFIMLPIVVLFRIKKDNIKGYDEFMVIVLGNRIGKFVEIILTLFLFISYSVMLAGGGAIVKENFNLNYNYGILIMALLTLIVFIFNVKGLSYANLILIPLLVLSILYIGIKIIGYNGLEFSNHIGANITSNGNWLTSSILYISYNSLSAIVIFTTIDNLLKNKKDIIKTSILSGILLGVMAFSILIPLLIKYTDVFGFEIPMLAIASSLNESCVKLYSFILMSAMFTTAIASGFSLITRLSKIICINKNILAIILPIVTLPISNLGFSKLVTTLYPLFGYLGLFIILIISIEFLLRLISIKKICKLR
ncbi:hypothetical protein GOQ29_02090 [Clostridium sp. D2Q-14]|uniref:YkvI family membrane protein n=1 Tax=Anaeromonas gelatinilytica TaxID=2683194 RepID=UPI00193B16A7|nr:hypothetical protein [Anaeromonas gelatinilytica]MBS4534401.1 hypothetical protein [Anaeromonas gelatinilytica]